ncbi:MAG TPA: fibronectin type III domain-containing protein [Solirubrobacterales bacterium]|nr:fibronectin type III domain-containing protein [Solirubrobacterales bacterium]
MFFNDITEATAELNVNIAGPGITEVITGSTIGTPTTTSAVVSGQVDPHGFPTEFAFEWGQSSLNHLTTYGEAGAAQGFTAVSKNIEGLEPATTYKYRITATNGFGTATGAEGTFTTAPAPPVVLTEMAEGVKKESAKLWASINPLGSPTSYHFEYGTTTSYGSAAPMGFESVGSGRTPVRVSQKISGLKAATTYHYRVKAYSEGGTSYGLDGTFTTPSTPAVTAEAASYVNTLEPQLNATINPERADTHYQFEYGTTESYGTKVPIPAADIGTAGVPVAVERGVKGLARSTTYHYRVTAENEVGVVHGADRSFTTLPPCKGAEAKCVWSLQEASNPSSAERFELKGVSCSAATSCVAVGKNLYNGKSFVDRWNGSSWSLFSGTVNGEMKHLSCVAAGCLVVGTVGGAAQTWWVGEISGLSGWAIYPMTPPVPAGASETKLEDVDCMSTSACTAVGSYKGPEGTYHPLVERWNGTAWSLQSAPNPAEGSAQNAMLSVSCNSNGCIAVGEAAGKPVAETWISGTWALSSAKLPTGAKGGKLSSISCNSSSCVAVGNSYESAGQEKALAESFNGIAWSLMSAPSPAEAKGFVELAGVSCPSATACTATGYYAPSVSGGMPTEMRTLVEAWNGSSWSIQASPNAAQRYNLLVDVSCTSASACTSVGEDSPGFGQNPESLAERWNGSLWSTQVVVNPELPIETELKAVSCSSNTLCIGVGKNLFAEKGFVEVWNGTSWMVASSFAGEMRKISCNSGGCITVGVKGGVAEAWLVFQIGGAWTITSMSPTLPSGGTETVLSGLSCSASTACTAVGSYKGPEGTYHPLVERWNGTVWSLQSAPNPAGGSAQNAMLGVSCTGAPSCVAVGEAAGKPVAETWNGSSWSLSASPPLPAGAKAATFAAVSCGSWKACMAVGSSNEGAGTEKSLAERWNGSAWSIVPTPAPAGAKGFVNLTDVACLSPNACFAAGSYAPEVSGGAPVSLKSLVESWEGTEWSVLTSPNLASQTFNSLAGISCSTSIDCTAVGGATSSLTKRPPVQLAMRFE